MSTHDPDDPTGPPPSTRADEDAESATDSSVTATEATDPTTRLAVLEAENRKLRQEYARARTVTYRKTALALAGIGAVALLGALAFPVQREVLLVLGGIGVFGAVLTYYLAPEHVVSAAVGERIYSACERNLANVASALGLRETAIYLPGTGGATQLFVPLLAAHAFPGSGAGPFVLEGDERGLLLEPTGEALFREFEPALRGPLPDRPAALAGVLADGVAEQFELATGVTSTVDHEEGRITFAIGESAFGAVDRFDHPVASFLAVGLARGLDRPVTVEVTAGDERAAWLVTCRYDEAETQPSE